MTIRGEAWQAEVPWQELLPVVRIGLGAVNIHIPTAQPMVEIMKHTDLQVTPMQDGMHLASRADERLPAHAGEVERNLRRQVVAPGMLETLDEGEGVQQRLILGRRVKRG